MSHLGGKGIYLRFPGQHQRFPGPAAHLFRRSILGPSAIAHSYAPTGNWTGGQTVRDFGTDPARGPDGQAASLESPRRNGAAGSAGETGGNSSLAHSESG